MTNRTSKDEAIALLSGPFGSEILKNTASYVGPLFWGLQEGRRLSVKGSGSVFFLRPEDKSFAVTANHVFQSYVEKKNSIPTIRCQISGLPFDLEERVIDTSDALDIATFQISSDEIRKLDKIELTKWPPTIPETGKGVLFAGFPGQERLDLSPHGISFGIYAALGIATSVSNKNITCQFERDYWVEVPGFDLPPEAYGIEGLSGAPLLTVIERSGLWLWGLGGVIYEFSSNLEIVVASRADKILPDGTLLK